MHIRGKTALIIEDDLDCAALIEKILVNAGVKVHLAHNLTDAKTKLFEAAPHFIFLDINLAQKNGLQFFVLLNKYAIDIPTFILSGENEKTWFEKARELGAQEYIQKPVSSKIILEKLKKHFLDDRYYQIQFDDQNSAKLKVTIPGEIARIGEIGNICISPASFNKNQKLKMSGPIFNELGLSYPQIDVVTSNKSQNVGPKRQRTEVHFVGLTEDDEQNIRKKVLRWR